MKTTYEISGITLTIPMFTLQWSQKKRGKRGLKIYLRKLGLKISQAKRKKQLSRYRKHRRSPKR